MLYKRLPLLIALAILLASIGVTALQLYPIYLEATELDTHLSSTQKSIKPSPQADPAKNRNIASFSMFGDFNAVVETKPNIEELPKTSLRLTLTGVSATENQDNARALIEGPDRSTESYRVGDTLPGNANLHSVHKDRVILSRSGKLETLFFSESDSSTRLLSSVNSPDNSREVPVNSVGYNTNGQNPAYPINIPESAPQMTGEQKQSIRDKLSALRSRLRKQ